MNPNEISILSDDLRPRDTPNHTLFKDFVLKPMVPDLSITEDPRSEEPIFPNRCQQSVTTQENQYNSLPNRPKALLEDCKTYSEWRKKSAQNAKPQVMTANHSHEHSYVHYINGRTNPTVLDNLNSQVQVQSYDTVAASQRQSLNNSKDSPVNGTSLKTSQSNLRNVSQKSWDTAPVHVNSSRGKSGSEDLSPRQDYNTKAPSRKSHSRHSSDSHFGHSNNYFAGPHPEAPNFIGYPPWPHPPMTAVNYNGMPMYHPYPHVGIPPCNGMPSKPNPALPVPSPKSRGISRHSGSVSGHSFNDSVVFDNLYQMVLSQSEQLKMLQAQVEKLVMSQENHRCKANPDSEKGNRRSTTVVERGTQTSDGESNAEDGAKMSIGVMTSFIHTVAYTERLGLVDSRNKGLNRNMAGDPRNKMHNGHSRSASTSPPSQALPTSSSSSRSDVQVSPESGTQSNCCECHECIDRAKKNQRKTQMKRTQHYQVEEPFARKGPGVSTAIRTVRGCQAALENESFPNDGDNGRSALTAGVDESITLNGVDLPTVVELPVSPPSSMHIDVQEYDASSTEDGSSSDVELSSLSDSDVDDGEAQQRRPKTYNNVLGPANRLREHRESAGDPYGADEYWSGRKTTGNGRENRPPRPAMHPPQVNSVLKKVAFQQDPKPREEDSAKNLKELALKYLRENYPEELNSTADRHPSSKSSGPKRVQDMAMYNMGSNMSFATFRYLQRYNLLPENLNMNCIEELPTKFDVADDSSPFRQGVGDGLHGEQDGSNGVRGARAANPANAPQDRTSRPRRDRRKDKHHPAHFESPTEKRRSGKVRHEKHAAPHVANGQPIPATAKILDITALRQQPKLL